jgi:nicotinamidase-related amidase
VRPSPGDHFLLKKRYSAFDCTPLTILLAELAVDRILLAGMATERASRRRRSPRGSTATR